MQTARALAPAPEALAAPGGVPFGRYLGAIPNLDTASWDFRLEPRAPWPRRFFQRKAWSYVGVLAPELVCGFAIFDGGYLANAFVYVFERKARRLTEEKALRPFGFPYGFKPTPGASWALAAGKRSFSITPGPGGGWAARLTGERLRVELEMAGGPGMSTVAPSTTRPFNYTYKLCGTPARARITVDGRTVDPGPEAEVLGVYDFTLGYPPRHTYWNWAALAGRTADGRRFGANLVANFNNGLENAYWLGDQVIPLAQTVFRYDRRDTLAPWHIHTEDGQLDVRFYPEGKRAERITVGLVASDFQQPCGRFEGTLVTPEGPLAVSGSGVTEEHWAVW